MFKAGELRKLRDDAEDVYREARREGRNGTAEGMRKILSVLSQAIPEYDVETEAMAKAKPPAEATTAVKDGDTN